MPHRHITAIIASLCLIGPSHAAFRVDQVNIGCTGDLLIAGVDALSMQCSGELSLQGTSTESFIEATESIRLFSVGSLRLSNLRLLSPNIELLSDSAIAINANVLLLPSSTTGQTGPTLHIGVGGLRLSTAPEDAHAATVSIGSAGDVRVRAEQIVGTISDVRVSGGQLQISAVPEPSTLALLMGGLGLMAFVRRRA